MQTCQRTRIRAGGVCILVMLAACGPSRYIPLKPEQESSITSTRVHATIVQEEVDVVIQASNTSVVGLGLLGALAGAVVDTAITSHRAGQAGELVDPIRREVSDFDLGADPLGRRKLIDFAKLVSDPLSGSVATG